MTPSIVHVTNMTPPGSDNPTLGPIAPGFPNRTRPACDWVCEVKEGLYTNITARATYWKSRADSPVRKGVTGGVGSLTDLISNAAAIEKNIVEITSKVGLYKS